MVVTTTPRWFFWLETLWVLSYITLGIWTYIDKQPDGFELRADVYSLRVHVAVIAVALSNTALASPWCILILLIALASDIFNLVELAVYTSGVFALRTCSIIVAAYQTWLSCLFISIYLFKIK